MNWLRLIKGFSLSFVFVSFFIYAISGMKIFFDDQAQAFNQKMLSASVSNSLQSIAPDNKEGSINKTFAKLEINSKSAISIESDLSDADKIIFSKDEDKKLPIASLTKLMTAVIVLDNYDLSKNITLNSKADSQDPMKQDLKLGDTMSTESFLDMMLIKSSNKSAYALSEVIGESAFVSLMNKKAAEIGLKNTSFADPTGLSSQNISTARDLAELAQYILKNYPKIASISKEKEFYVPGFGKVENTDQLLGEIPEIVCSKTGFTPEAKGCLVLVINNSKNNSFLINVILGADDRFSEMRKLINWTNATCK